VEQLKAGIRKATIAMNIFPVLCGSSFKNKGVQTLLDAVVDYLPSPLDIPPMIGSNPDNMEEKIVRKADDNEPFAALGFKIMTDPFVGQLIFIRVYSGQLKTGDLLDNSIVVVAESVPYGQPYTYDLLPSGDTGFYWANGILVGSTLAPFQSNGSWVQILSSNPERLGSSTLVGAPNR